VSQYVPTKLDSDIFSEQGAASKLVTGAIKRGGPNRYNQSDDSCSDFGHGSVKRGNPNQPPGNNLPNLNNAAADANSSQVTSKFGKNAKLINMTNNNISAAE